MQVRKRIGSQEFNIRLAGKGDPILLVHGFPLDHSMWAAQIEALSQTHSVIAPDLRGFGKSREASSINFLESISMLQFAEDLASILDVLNIGQPVHYCGLSMGGYIAWQFAQHEPKRLRSLILCDTKATADSLEAKQARLETAERVLTEGSEILALSMPEKLFSPKTLQEQPAVVASVQETIRATSPHIIAAALRGMAARPDMTSELVEINVPTLVIVGEDDVLTTPQEMQSIADSIPNARFAKISRAGHMAPLEQPDMVNQAILQFLSTPEG